ncbi:LOW QUALITY PROTEIN: trissin receptor-like [Tachypleus tridentatus]|uniref:LOW QUALITY PROTEIN: trissin receptor-like n=1 Tax=Tachypleus tridentatus TaxID=6853 RepID=UPI003FD01F9F
MLLLFVSYTFVFCCSIFGNLLVMVVVFLHRRLRTVTNFFLTNLAVADFCVGVFCVFQNLSLYLMSSWPFGNFLCKMYHFIQSLSYNTSIAILVVICVERCVAIIYPLWSKQAFTLGRLRAVITIVWLVSAIYCSPRLVMYGTAELPSVSGSSVECFMQRKFYDSEIYDVANFVFLLVIPLVIISVLYTKIAVRLWKSTVDSVEYGQVELRHVRDVLTPKTIIRARRKVLRLLVAIVLCFAFCNLPFHVRKLWQYWYPYFNGTTKSSVFFTISTTLLLYFNSGINPILYAFLSENFRNSMKEVMCCRRHTVISRFVSCRSTPRAAHQEATVDQSL